MSNVALATVKQETGISFKAIGGGVDGGEQLDFKLIAIPTDEDGKVKGSSNPAYISYFLAGLNPSFDSATQRASASVLNLHYDFFTANFNSLNKRMGELRDNPHTQGGWGRIFFGSLESTQGLNVSSDYFTLQAGYDYSFAYKNAKSYLGLALAYSHSSGKSLTGFRGDNIIGGTDKINIDGIQSHAAELGVYHSFFSDLGWYNDTVLKLSYINSGFNFETKRNSLDNFGFVLSDEVGYRYLFGEKKDFYVDPQLELGLGYLSASSFKAQLLSKQGTNTLQISQNANLTLRTRLGASVGKKFGFEKQWATLYLGLFYEYDAIFGKGGQIYSSRTNHSSALKSLSSSGRGLFNLGANLALTEQIRAYADVEKSFADRSKSHTQFNFGGRYSF